VQTEYGALFKIDDIKASDSGWEVAGYASTFGNVDHGGDVVMRGAFDKTLAEWKAGRNKVRFLWAHDTWQVLGVPKDLRTDDRGLFGTFKISKTQLGEDTHTLLKDGAVDSFSIGYLPADVEFDDVGVRKLLAVDLLEVSVVAIPMNDQAAVTRVKAAAEPDSLKRLSIAGHIELATEVLGPLGEKMRDFLATFREDGHELTDTKRRALTAFLETFSGMDAVRSEAERLLQPTPAVTEALGDDPELRELFLKNRRRRLERLGIRMEAA
jgi:HK97 family phage prohead protease